MTDPTNERRIAAAARRQQAREELNTARAAGLRARHRAKLICPECELTIQPDDEIVKRADKLIHFACRGETS